MHVQVVQRLTHVEARRVHRPGRAGYGYEITDGAGTVVETGEIRLSGAWFAAFADVPDAWPRLRPFSSRPRTAEVLAWLAENGPHDQATD